MHGDIREYANTANLKPGHALLSIATSLGGNRSRPPSVIETTFPDTTAAVLSDLVSQRIQSDSVQGSTRVRLQITIDSVPRFEVGRSEFCRPALANRQELTRILAGANQQAERYGTVRLELFVTGSGRVSEVKIDATSGDDMIDGLAIGVARAMRFKPASIDYVPTAVWIQMPVVFRGR
ncbi:MAG: energy transducer TonB [Gemmatimonadetes bacterium]|uniref:Energy transducer TonB n=1 Tax=Candidatus Kutchimonas denitrificans TaxID=3056748 RepID=A0AAE5CCG5_9BACT|nr:energy transducer TonB [Gemmatimonadota bacterium]NIR75615.1 energy transducer TonB [Candidatus Kutchimonas denitrificans]NIS02916.1 energy transducer TonB [Gemmatimonadota bacterium]NIT68638.1 energy transducer TonB [Gemmatimonadota bacterium]NIV25317.1 TonB family protein [Gemmatimonadota bacterium]